MDQANLITSEKEIRARPRELDGSVDVSVVIPVSERHDNLNELYTQYARELSIRTQSYEFIFVLDGPQDEALQALKALRKDHPEVRIVILNRWVGEAVALAVGFQRARASVIVTLSSYFQVDPGELHKVLKKLEENNADLVISRRYPRIDSVFNRIQSGIFHWIVRLLTGTQYHDISCGLRAMKRIVTDEVQLYGDLHRFFPLLAYQRGFKIAEIPVRQSQRDARARIYRAGVYLGRLLDILTLFFLFKFTQKPLRFFGLVGSGLFGVGTIITGYLGLYRLFGFGAIAVRPLLILGVLLMVLGIQLFSIGLLGEIIIFTHARDIKEYQVDEIIE